MCEWGLLFTRTGFCRASAKVPACDEALLHGKPQDTDVVVQDAPAILTKRRDYLHRGTHSRIGGPTYFEYPPT